MYRDTSLTEIEIGTKTMVTVDGVRLAMTVRQRSLTPQLHAMLGTYVALRGIKTQARDLIAKEFIKGLTLLEGK